MFVIDPSSVVFPHPEVAAKSGPAAVGGSMSVEMLKLAYQYGYFPWFNAGEPILWWNPDPRFVIFTDEVRVAKSMRPYFNQNRYKITFDQQFLDVILACKNTPRNEQMGTWITTDFVSAYQQLHELGLAHSVEVWNDKNELVGGLYGVSQGRVFSGESMFSSESNASKFALIAICQILAFNGFEFIDAQMENPFLKSMGGKPIPRKTFLSKLAENRKVESIVGNWQDELEIPENISFLRQL